MSTQKPFDIIVFGASGYTGRLVAEYLRDRLGADSPVKWAMAGRDEAKLLRVREETGVATSVPVVTADTTDPESVKAMVASARVICTTVGPYQLYGEPLVAACAAAGTHYVDLCGEPAWMRRMIDRYDDEAKESGARIVFSCGFDSIPSDLGVQFLQEALVAKTGSPAARVKCRVRSMNGKFSGGTAASLRATLAAAERDPGVTELLKNPFALTPGFTGPAQPPGLAAEEDRTLGVWVAPFIMAPINTRNVHRTNFLLGHPYGKDFVYDEMMVAGPGEGGRKVAEAIAGANPLGSKNAPAPGEGPTREEREKGSYDLLFLAISGGEILMKASVRGSKDPGYGSTSRMIAESALCHLEPDLAAGGGISTPGAAFGARLLRRLREHAEIEFQIEE